MKDYLSLLHNPYWADSKLKTIIKEVQNYLFKPKHSLIQPWKIVRGNNSGVNYYVGKVGDDKIKIIVC